MTRIQRQSIRNFKIDMSLEQDILKTIAYFDLFGMPLTKEEIFKNLYSANSRSLSEIIQTLELLKSRSLHEKEGFYFFNSQNLELRKDRYLIAKEKLSIAKKRINFLARLPFVKAIFICNNLSYFNAPDGSDIDLAIITAKGRIWSARFFSAALMKLLGQRPQKNNRKNKICLSFFVSEDDLNLEKLTYDNDIHFIYWLNQFLPVYAEKNLANKFFTENEWTKKFLPNYFNYIPTEKLKLSDKNYFKKIIEKLFSKSIGNFLEKNLKKIQFNIFPETIKQKISENTTDVFVSDSILKFHDKDKRLEIKRKWEEKTAKILS